MPPRVVQLGTVLDVVIERRVNDQWEIATVGGWRGWLLAANEGCMGQAPGRARLYLFESARGATLELEPDSPEYERWHERRAKKRVEHDVPDVIATLQGRCLRIGYRSDKWQRPRKWIDYEHDFQERGHTAPLIYTDADELDRARAAVLVGGDMRVTPRGLD